MLSMVVRRMVMDKNAFVKIGYTRIKLSNIKNYGISDEHFANDSLIEDNYDFDFIYKKRP